MPKNKTKKSKGMYLQKFSDANFQYKMNKINFHKHDENDPTTKNQSRKKMRFVSELCEHLIDARSSKRPKV